PGQGYSIVALDGPAAAAPPKDKTSAVLIVEGCHASLYSALFPLLLRHALPAVLVVDPSQVSRIPRALTLGEIAELVMSGLVDVRLRGALALTGGPIASKAMLGARFPSFPARTAQ